MKKLFREMTKDKDVAKHLSKLFCRLAVTPWILWFRDSTKESMPINESGENLNDWRVMCESNVQTFNTYCLLFVSDNKSFLVTTWAYFKAGKWNRILTDSFWYLVPLVDVVASEIVHEQQQSKRHSSQLCTREAQRSSRPISLHYFAG